MRSLLNIFFFVFTFVLFLACQEEDKIEKTLSDFIPSEIDVAIKITDLEHFTSNIKQNNILNSWSNEGLLKIVTETNHIFQHSLTSEGILCLKKRNSNQLDYVFITKKDSTVIATDSIKKTFTTVLKDDFLLIGSKSLLDKIAKEDIEKDFSFKKAINRKSKNSTTIIYKVKHPLLYTANSLNTIDLSITPDGLKASGVTLVDSLQLLTIFKGQIPQVNELEKIIPTKASHALSFTFSDATEFIKHKFTNQNIKQYQTTIDLLASINEVGLIKTAEINAIALKSIDPNLTMGELLTTTSQKSIFHEKTIYNFSNSSLFESAFQPLVTNTNMQFLFKWENFFIFTETEKGAKKYISILQNKDCLFNTSYFKMNKKEMTESSSLTVYAMKEEAISLAQSIVLNNTYTKDFKPSHYPSPFFSALQYTYEKEYAHINLVCLTPLKKQPENKGALLVLTSVLKNESLGSPQFFHNHHTKQKNIFTQDINNSVHLFSEKGESIWSKQIDGPILGRVFEIDLYKNGKKQIAFTTQNTFYILDRNGNPVAPFTKSFKETITQPLSVFDYDKKQDYRFLITQGKNISMYNDKGKKVNGFTFKGTKSDITQPPQHLRIEGKDYIVIPEKNGTLNILSRTGKPRIKTRKTFNFSENPIGYEDKKIVVIEKNNIKNSINASGKVSSIKMNPSLPYYFTNYGKTNVSMLDNKLFINKKTIELPFGIYTSPQIFIANKKIYIAVTETQESKVYVYNDSGKLQNGFPVFGKSSIDMTTTKEKEELLIVVLGDKKELIIYSL